MVRAASKFAGLPQCWKCWRCLNMWSFGCIEDLRFLTAFEFHVLNRQAKHHMLTVWGALRHGIHPRLKYRLHLCLLKRIIHWIFSRNFLKSWERNREFVLVLRQKGAETHLLSFGGSWLVAHALVYVKCGSSCTQLLKHPSSDSTHVKAVAILQCSHWGTAFRGSFTTRNHPF